MGQMALTRPQGDNKPARTAVADGSRYPDLRGVVVHEPRSQVRLLSMSLFHKPNSRGAALLAGSGELTPRECTHARTGAPLGPTLGPRKSGSDPQVAPINEKSDGCESVPMSLQSRDLQSDSSSRVALSPVSFIRNLSGYEPGGRMFESCRAHQPSLARYASELRLASAPVCEGCPP